MIATVVFGVCLAYIAYVIGGYPLTTAWLARRKPSPVRRGATLRTVSAIIAVHNGADFLRKKLECLLELNYPQELLEIIVASDGSTDATAQIAAEFASRGVRLVEISRRGKPAALNAGIAEARHEILLLTDVRQRLDRNCLQFLVESFDDPEVGVVSGELVILSGTSQEQEDVTLYRRYENWMRRHLGRIDSTFGATGCIYAMRRNLAVRIPDDILLDDMYLPLAAFFRGYRLLFDERARAFDYPTALDVEFRRKVRTLAGNYQVLMAYPQLLGPANRMLLHFLSYKFARLLLPWVFIALFASSLFLPETLRSWVAVAEVLVLLLIAIDPLVPEAFPLKRISSPARTFFALMAASLVAVSVFFIPPRRLWKETRVAAPGQP